MSGIVGNNLGRGSGLVKATAVVADSVSGASIVDDAIDSEHYVDASIDNAHLADDAVGLAEMASGTDGNIISYDGSGNPTAVATGNDGQVLTSSGAGAICAFEDAGGGGKLLSVDSRFQQVASTHSTTTYTATGVWATITPTASGSKIFVSMTFSAHSYRNGTTATDFYSKIYRDIEGAGYTSEFPDPTSYTTGYTHGAVSGERAMYGTFTFTFLDSPSYSLTDEITYKLYARKGATDNGYIDATETCVTLMEIGA